MQTLLALKRATWRDYLTLCKPRVVAMMLVTVLVGMVLGSDALPSFFLICATLVGVAACASSAAAMNHWIDRHFDIRMQRTCKRPVADGRLTGYQVLPFAMGLALFGFWVLMYFVNALTAWLTIATLLGYAGVYTGYLKHATVQNIVIGGLAGAAPPLLGWTAVTNMLDPQALLLVLIIFTWTPPHFWALAIYRYEDYEQAGIPMLPVLYGIQFTKKMIFLYTILLLIVSELPYLVGMCGLGYALCALILGLKWIKDAWSLIQTENRTDAFRLFKFSITYLFCLFLALLGSHFGRSYGF